MDEQSILGNNHIEDVRWLCSLSESELDFLMGLKTLIHQRAKKIGHEALVKKFDLRTLRALGFVLMENLKGQLKDLSATSGFECNLLNHNLNGSFSSMTIEDLIPYICSDRRKRIADMFFQDTPPNQKQKIGDGGCV
ncbi:Spc97/Spc98 family of spindle pole body (SBP) component [Abeliophyllum distichum]|uniref:Spc97/Spc98 family of spindle pole body (SBP) component n=1 Tax=Abeliophyllum distichum TaxID=126358 RepID=A0ABD1P822_9LAMI